MPFTKGHKINVGRIMPENERKKHAMFGDKNPQYMKPSWNKGKRCPEISNDKNGCWKGDEASYTAKHIWIKRKIGKAFMCMNHNCEKISKTYHLANISGQYKRDVDDWIMLCAKCHAIFDGRVKCQ